MRHRQAWFVMALLALFVAACAGSPEEVTGEVDEEAVSESPGDAVASECRDAVQAAAEMEEMEDAVDNLDPALSACEDIAEFVSTVQEFPEMFEGTDPETFVRERCEASTDPAVTESAICSAVTE